MDIKKLANLTLIFTIKRILEIIGIFVFIMGILLLIAFFSYSPTDPNFIFPENTEINNLLGFQGSYISDLFFQSFGQIAYLIPITYLFTGINIFRKKEIFLFIENTFFIVIYTLIGSIFFSYFYKDTLTFYINGNGGFIGNYFNQIFLKYLNSSYETSLYYIFIFLLLSFF